MLPVTFTISEEKVSRKERRRVVNLDQRPVMWEARASDSIGSPFSYIS
jgi:hypothetical protein